MAAPSWWPREGGARKASRVCIGVCGQRSTVSRVLTITRCRRGMRRKKENDISYDLLPCAAPARATQHSTTAATVTRCTTACVMRSRQTLRLSRRAMQPATQPQSQPQHSHTLSTMQAVQIVLYSCCLWPRAAASLPHGCRALNLSCSQVISHTRQTTLCPSCRHSRQSLHHDATRASTCMSQPSRSVPLTT